MVLCCVKPGSLQVSGTALEALSVHIFCCGISSASLQAPMEGLSVLHPCCNSFGVTHQTL